MTVLPSSVLNSVFGGAVAAFCSAYMRLLACSLFARALSLTEIFDWGLVCPLVAVPEVYLLFAVAVGLALEVPALYLPPEELGFSGGFGDGLLVLEPPVYLEPDDGREEEEEDDGFDFPCCPKQRAVLKKRTTKTDFHFTVKLLLHLI